MARRRFLPRRGGRGLSRLFLKWTGQGLAAEEGLAVGTPEFVTIVAPSDYAGGTTANAVEPGGCTLQRIIGQVSLRSGVAGSLAFMYIMKLGSFESAQNPAGFTPVISGDTLWQYATMVTAATGHVQVIDVDIRVKRKLEDDQVVFGIAAVGQALTYYTNFRALIRSSG